MERPNSKGQTPKAKLQRPNSKSQSDSAKFQVLRDSKLKTPSVETALNEFRLLFL
jgi:hypothetical protein